MSRHRQHLYGHSAMRVVSEADVTRILDRMRPDDTVVLPKVPPDLSWLTTPECYPPVRVPENRSSIPGVVDKPDWAMRLILLILTLALGANAVALLAVLWVLR